MNGIFVNVSIKQITPYRHHRPCHSHTCGGQGHESPAQGSCEELEFRNYGTIPVQGLLLTVERQIEGI